MIDVSTAHLVLVVCGVLGIFTVFAVLEIRANNRRARGCRKRKGHHDN